MVWSLLPLYKIKILQQKERLWQKPKKGQEIIQKLMKGLQRKKMKLSRKKLVPSKKL